MNYLDIIRRYNKVAFTLIRLLLEGSFNYLDISEIIMYISEGRMKGLNYFYLDGKKLDRWLDVTFHRCKKNSGLILPMVMQQISRAGDGLSAGSFEKARGTAAAFVAKLEVRHILPLPDYQKRHQISPSNFHRNGERTEWARQKGLESILVWCWNLHLTVRWKDCFIPPIPLSPCPGREKTLDPLCLGIKIHSANLILSPFLSEFKRLSYIIILKRQFLF